MQQRNHCKYIKKQPNNLTINNLHKNGRKK